MTPERWRQIEAAFHAALESPAEERAGFLDRSCGEDADLRREVESLLSLDSEEESADDLSTYCDHS